MKLATIVLSLFAFAGCAVADEMPAAQVMGHGRTVDVDDADAVASMNQFVVGARSLEITNGRRLTSALDKLEVMIKNVDCSVRQNPSSLAIVRWKGSFLNSLFLFFFLIGMHRSSCTGGYSQAPWNQRP